MASPNEEEQVVIGDDESVSFAGQGLKLDSQQDAAKIVDSIRGCPNMKYFNLEGNTLGVDAAGAIAEAFESASNFKYAILKDIFTGRLKNEIPLALKSLSQGIILSNTRLTELDLSDNAFGPIAMEALAPFLEHEACESLKILRLNNNGLGPSGSKILGRALQNLKKLQVFICGRNRLENPGAKAIAAALEMMPDLKQVEMIQNGINTPGIEALSHAVKENLEILNLSDNTMKVEGGRMMAEALKRVKNLRELNLSDCLLKGEGFKLILQSLRESGILPGLKSMIFQGNEIGGQEIVDLIIETFSDHTNFNESLSIDLSCNNFGEDSCALMMDEIGQKVKLIIEDDEGEYEEDDDEFVKVDVDEVSDEEDEEEEDEEDEEDEESDEDTNEGRRYVENPEEMINSFMGFTIDNLCRDYVHLSSEQFEENTGTLHAVTLKDLSYIIQAVVRKDSPFDATQSLLAHMGLIKSEEGYHKKNFDLRGVFVALNEHLEYLPENYRSILQLFLKRAPENKIPQPFCQKLLQSL
ncbi:uncharacterized protein LOC141856227 [Brevipalpus obovatus]|uniref:uncharacterized protein LOC141856227 n=1 Tax=Brevipalpus obovatus TaxID=246614 RepID=UPI003D9E99FC